MDDLLRSVRELDRAMHAHDRGSAEYEALGNELERLSRRILYSNDHATADLLNGEGVDGRMTAGQGESAA